MKSCIVIAIALMAVTGCAPDGAAPDRGVGFDDFATFELERAQREAELSTPRNSIIPPPQITTLNSSPDPDAISAGELAQAGIGQQSPNSGNDPLRAQGLDASPSNPAPELINATGLSDEQSFDAVTERETIESDAERIAAQAAVREQVAVTPVPDRPANTGPNIVKYALEAPNEKGQEWYSRSFIPREERFQRNCAEYLTPDDAQRDFLARGGPERDRRGLDPDGDGFACGWDPAPFIQAIRN